MKSWKKVISSLESLVDSGKRGTIEWVDDSGIDWLGWVKYDGKIIDIEGLKSERVKIKRILKKANII